MRIEPAELPKIEASHGLDIVARRAETLVNNDGDETEVALLIEKDGVLLPEFLGVARSPSQLLPVHLVGELLQRAEHLLISIEEVVHLLKHVVDVAIYPVSVLELDDQTKSINV